jgi:hypothetical protein
VAAIVRGVKYRDSCEMMTATFTGQVAMTVYETANVFNDTHNPANVISIEYRVPYQSLKLKHALNI